MWCAGLQRLPIWGAGVRRVHTQPLSTATPITDASPLGERPFLLTEQEAARLIGVKPATLKVWRSKSRRAGRLIGPRWVEPAGEGATRIIRYRIADLEAWAAAGAVRLEPRKRPGRPRKGAQP